MLKKIGFGFAGILLAASPLIASAQTADASSQIAALVAEIQQLEAQLAQLQGGSTSPSCINLTNNLYAGESDAQTGGDVTTLQQFLGISPTTGYFGPATLQAVQTWQSAHSVVSSGTPDTTGYGFVGPQTRVAMGCGGNATATTTSTSSNVTVAATAVSTANGSAATVASSQVQAQDVTVGTGTMATPGSIVSITYTGKLADGTVFDSSAAHANTPLTFTLGAQGLIPGLQIGINGMRVGGERLITIPPDLAYGGQVVKDPTGAITIPANSTLTFDVQLLQVQAATAANTGGSVSNTLPVVNEQCSANTVFTTNLQQGSVDPQVAAVKLFLGAPLGSNSTLFDSTLTQYVEAFQQKYASSILAPVGKTVSDGIWGFAERAKANFIESQCSNNTQASSAVPVMATGSTNFAGTHISN
jgi:FKBP-type peptidyl-prolyl cis-trans isomerase